jgi:hypothetical protein
MAVIGRFAIFISSTLGFGGSNNPSSVHTLSDYVCGNLEDTCAYIDNILIAFP